MSAVISPCQRYRYRLDRDVQEEGVVIGFYGVNGSTAGEEENDQTVRKWIGFTKRIGGRKFVVGNPFAFRATDVKYLAKVDDPVGPLNGHYLREIIRDVDMHVPCWGSRDKVPNALRYHFDMLADRLFASGKPIWTFGFTASGDPMHPLMLPYDVQMVEWTR